MTYLGNKEINQPRNGRTPRQPVEYPRTAWSWYRHVSGVYDIRGIKDPGCWYF